MTPLPEHTLAERIGGSGKADLEAPPAMTPPHPPYMVPQIRHRGAIGHDGGAGPRCWLPSDGPFGNLQHWQTRIVLRVDEANRGLASAFAQGPRVTGSVPSNLRSRHRLDLESAVYMLRRAADEIVALHAVLSHLEEQGRYPVRIGSDCVAALLKHGAALDAPPFTGHRETLRILNDIGNAEKHVFVETGLATAGGHEPAISAVGLRRDGASVGPKLFHVSVRALIEDFDRFYADATDWLGTWSARHLRKSAA
jgi:hypothetical protein